MGTYIGKTYQTISNSMAWSNPPRGDTPYDLRQRQPLPKHRVRDMLLLKPLVLLLFRNAALFRKGFLPSNHEIPSRC